MRYWIYWNDLVQGPFEAGELASLHAFTADLLVCEEDRQDWTPAAAITELLPYFRVLPSSSVLTSAPPPPPPSQPPTLSPLQGEFIVESQGQQALFDLNGSKNYFFRPAEENAESADTAPPPVTMPFHFSPLNLSPLPEAPEPKTEVRLWRPPEIHVVPPPAVVPPIEETPPPPVREIEHVRPVPVIHSEPLAIPDFAPSHVRVSDEPQKTRLWPWVVGLGMVLGLVGLVFYMRANHPKEIILPVAAPVAVPVRAPVPVVKPVLKPKKILPPRKAVKPVKKIAPKPVPVVKAVPVRPAIATNSWQGREQEAIDLTLKQKIYAGQRTIGENAKLMLDNMHAKELVHAADAGERLYLPDKMNWSALHEEGPRYRVYLNFLASQANGERNLARSNQFSVDLEHRSVTALDDGTRQDFYDPATMQTHQPNAKADDIDNILRGVDIVNRQKLRAVILKSDKQKDEQTKTRDALKTAEDKLQKEIVYFRTKYAEKTLQNIAKAYMFATILKGK